MLAYFRISYVNNSSVTVWIRMFADFLGHKSCLVDVIWPFFCLWVYRGRDAELGAVRKRNFKNILIILWHFLFRHPLFSLFDLPFFSYPEYRWQTKPIGELLFGVSTNINKFSISWRRMVYFPRENKRRSFGRKKNSRRTRPRRQEPPEKLSWIFSTHFAGRGHLEITGSRGFDLERTECNSLIFQLAHFPAFFLRTWTPPEPLHNKLLFSRISSTKMISPQHGKICKLLLHFKFFPPSLFYEFISA